MTYPVYFNPMCCCRALVIVLAALVSSVALRAQPVGPTQPVRLEHADTFAGRIDSAGSGGSIIEMTGHVVLVQGVVRIEADKATLFELSNSAELVGNVKVTQPDMVMTAPRATYDGSSRVATAPNGVSIVDNGATLRAGAGDYNMYDRHARFRNGVVLTDKQTTLRASAGEYFTLDRKGVFTGGVTVASDSGTISSRDLTYYRDTKETFAFGSVVVTSKQNSAVLTGDVLHHRPADGYTVATGHPKLVQIDTTRGADSTGALRRDTTIITAVMLEAFRGEHDEYVATDSVKVLRGDLQAVAGRARFLPDQNVIALGAARVVADTVAVDTAAVGIAAGRPDTAAVTGARATDTTHAAIPTHKVGPLPVVWYDKSQLTGDSITVSMEEKKLRGIDVDRNAFAVSQGAERGRFDQIAAQRLIFDIDRDTIRHVRAGGLASSIYFLVDNGTPSGANRSSGDTINVEFDGGQVSTIEILGRRNRAEGEYFPEKLVIGQEEFFRLEGFRWYERDGKIASLDATLPRQPVITDVKPTAPNNEGGASSSRPRR